MTIRLDVLGVEATEIPELTECLQFNEDESEKVGKYWETKYMSPYEDVDGNLIEG